MGFKNGLPGADSILIKLQLINFSRVSFSSKFARSLLAEPLEPFFSHC